MSVTPPPPTPAAPASARECASYASSQAWTANVPTPYATDTPSALSNAGAVADLKAVSQNLMHESLFTADEIYEILTENDIRERVVNLARKESADDGLSALADQIAERLAQKLGL